MIKRATHVRIEELKTEVALVKNLEVSIGRIFDETWTEPVGPTPFPSITDLREWDFKLLKRYKPMYMPFCDLFCLCTFGKCDLTKDKRGACGLDMAAQQSRIKDFGEMTEVTISVVIPAFNEARTLGEVIEKCKVFCDDVIVVDDGSTDNTYEIAAQHGATVVQNEKKLGVAKATQKGFEAARGNIIVTIDADSQHEPSDLPKLVEMLTKGMGEVALGVRGEIPHRSERIINALVNLCIKCSDSGTGFRAIKADLAKKMKPHGTCFCGTFVLEAHKLGARIVEIPIQTKPRAYGKRKVKTMHLRQVFYVLKDLVFTFLGRFFSV